MITDHQLRVRALELALAHWGDRHPSSDDIVKTAGKFYKFMTEEGK